MLSGGKSRPWGGRKGGVPRQGGPTRGAVTHRARWSPSLHPEAPGGIRPSPPHRGLAPITCSSKEPPPHLKGPSLGLCFLFNFPTNTLFYHPKP